MVKLGIVGFGSIGSTVARIVSTEPFFKHQIKLVGICELPFKKEPTKAILKKLGFRVPILTLDVLIERSELILESASWKVSYTIARKALLEGKDIVVMSVGGIIDKLGKLSSLAKRTKGKVYIPSGAICGVDGVFSASLDDIWKVQLTTEKPPSALEGAPYVVKNKIDLRRFKKKTLLFDGNAYEAMQAFPANINVASTLSLAGVGPERTRVKIYVRPGRNRNVHNILLEGGFGKIVARTQNQPSPSNPKTSYLAVLSATAMIKRIVSPVEIGT